MVIDPVESLLVVRRSAEEIDHADFVLAHEKFVKLLRGVGGGPPLKANVLGKQLDWMKRGHDSKKQKEGSASYHSLIIGGSG